MVVMCPGSTVGKTEVVWWTYAVTLDEKWYGLDDADKSVGALEPLLQSYVMSLMDCNRPDGRRLVTEFGIAGVDVLPDDLYEEGKCCRLAPSGTRETNVPHVISLVGRQNAHHRKMDFLVSYTWGRFRST